MSHSCLHLATHLNILPWHWALQKLITIKQKLNFFKINQHYLQKSIAINKNRLSLTRSNMLRAERHRKHNFETSNRLIETYKTWKVAASLCKIADWASLRKRNKWKREVHIFPMIINGLSSSIALLPVATFQSTLCCRKHWTFCLKRSLKPLWKLKLLTDHRPNRPNLHWCAQIPHYAELLPQ